MKARSVFTFRKTHIALLLALFAGTLHAGSLWREGVTDERGMFADKRAKRVGDIVTIIVQEKATLDTALNLKTNKESKSGLAGAASNILNQVLASLPAAVFGKSLSSGTTSTTSVNNVVIPTVPTLPVSGANSYNGGGEIQNSQAITARAAVQVIDVLPNGNLVVEGLRSVSYSKEHQYASIRGIIRPYDILPDNTVYSTNVANAEVKIVSDGVLTDAQRKGWLLQINDKINPF